MTSPWNVIAEQRPDTPAGHRPMNVDPHSLPGGPTFPPRYNYEAARASQHGYAPTQILPPVPQFPPPPHYGFPQFPGEPPRAKRTGLVISMVVVAVLLVGGGVATFFLLNRKDEAVAPAGPGPSTSAVTNASGGTATISSIGSATTGTGTLSPHTSSSSHTTTAGSSSHSTSTEVPETSKGDLATAEALIDTWVDIVNDGDMDTASALVCEAEREDFRNSTAPDGDLEVLDVSAAGQNVQVTLGTVGSSSAADQYALTMRPTDTGYFLICDQPERGGSRLVIFFRPRGGS